jgi:hypothetical protein
MNPTQAERTVSNDALAFTQESELGTGKHDWIGKVQMS